MNIYLNWSDELKCIVLCAHFTDNNGDTRFYPIRNFYSPGGAYILRDYLRDNYEHVIGFVNTYRKDKIVSFVNTNHRLKISFY